MKSKVSEYSLGLDGVAAIVSNSNPLRSLSMSQVADIISGKVSQWRMIPGFADSKYGQAKIHVYIWDPEPEASALFGEKLPSSSAQEFEGGDELALKVSMDQFGIGFVSRTYAKNLTQLQLYNDETRPLSPTHSTIATREYLMTRDIYLYTLAGATGVPKEFVEFALSPNGQEILDDHGFVGHIPNAVPMIPPTRASGVYRTFVKTSARRLEINIYFANGSQDSSPHVENIQDLDRVADYWKAPHPSFARLLLAGFADNQPRKDEGEEDFNNDGFSSNLAETVKKELEKRNINPQDIEVWSFGDDLPIHSNADEISRAHNNRVEIWLR